MSAERGATQVQSLVVVACAFVAVTGLVTFSGRVGRAALCMAERISLMSPGAGVCGAPPRAPSANVAPQARLGGPKANAPHCDRDGTCTGAANCFEAGTPVLTPRGEQPIETLVVGDLVEAFDDASGELVTREILAVTRSDLSPVLRLSFESESGSASTVKVTYGHRFYTVDRGWIAAADLHIGEALETHDSLGAKSDRVRVASAFAEITPRTVYNFEVRQAHSYFVGASHALVHNDCEADAVRNHRWTPGEIDIVVANGQKQDAVLSAAWNADPYRKSHPNGRPDIQLRDYPKQLRAHRDEFSRANPNLPPVVVETMPEEVLRIVFDSSGATPEVKIAIANHNLDAIEVRNAKLKKCGSSPGAVPDAIVKFAIDSGDPQLLGRVRGGGRRSGPLGNDLQNAYAKEFRELLATASGFTEDSKERGIFVTRRDEQIFVPMSVVLDFGKLGRLAYARWLVKQPGKGSFVDIPAVEAAAAEILRKPEVNLVLDVLWRAAKQNIGSSVTAQYRWLTGDDFQRYLDVIGPEEGDKVLAAEITRLAEVDPELAAQALQVIIGRRLAQDAKDLHPDTLQRAAEAVAIVQLGELEKNVDTVAMAKWVKSAPDFVKRLGKVLVATSAATKGATATTAAAQMVEAATEAGMPKAHVGAFGEFAKKVIGPLDAHGQASSLAGVLSFIAYVESSKGEKGTTLANLPMLLKAIDAGEAYAKLGAHVINHTTGADFRIPKLDASLQGAGGSRRFFVNTLRVLKVFGVIADAGSTVKDFRAGVKSIERGNEAEAAANFGAAGTGVILTVQGGRMALAAFVGRSAVGGPAVMFWSTIAYIGFMGLKEAFRDPPDIELLKDLKVYREPSDAEKERMMRELRDRPPGTSATPWCL